MYACTKNSSFQLLGVDEYAPIAGKHSILGLNGSALYEHAPMNVRAFHRCAPLTMENTTFDLHDIHGELHKFSEHAPIGVQHRFRAD